MKCTQTYLIILLAAFMVGCEDDPCLKSSGSSVIERRDLPEVLNAISIADNLNLEIFIDTVNYLEVEAGSKVIDYIKTEMIDTVLVMTNANSCKYLRNFDQNLQLRLHVKSDLRNIEYEASGNLIMRDTLKITRFEFNSHTGGGNVTLLLKTHLSVLILAGGFTDLTVAGTTNTGRMTTEGSSWLRARYFRTLYSYTENRGAGDIITTAKDDLDCKITGAGNVVYYGNPKVGQYENTGFGKLIHGSH